MGSGGRRGEPGLWEAAAADPAARRHWARRAAQACACLRRDARIFKAAEPAFYRWQGLRDWLSGREGRAHRAWRRSLAVARRQGRVYEEGRTRYEIGRHLPPSDPARRAQLERACALFDRTGATWDLGRAQEALARG